MALSKYALVAAVCTAAVVIAADEEKPFDIIIADGRVVDGTGSAWFFGDIGIRNDSIAALGKLADRSATLRIDATGMVVSPGFIDIHSHGAAAFAGGGIFNVAAAESYLREGVTTIIGGPDGGGEVPLAPFLDKLAKLRKTINVASFIGHGSIRAEVIGMENRPATPAELDRMKQFARQGMLDGAFGLSTGLFYVPANYAPTEEVIELAKVVGPLGGIHISHMRDESENILEAVRETIRIGEEGNLPTQITHHKIMGGGNWGKSVETLRLVEEARARGVDVTIDQYPYTATSTGTGALFPAWSQEGGQKAFLKRISSETELARIKPEIIHIMRDRQGSGDAKDIVMSSCGFDPSLDGKNLAELTKKRGVPATIENAADTVIEIQKRGGCLAIYHAVGEPDVERILRFPYTMVASDGFLPEFGRGFPHPRSYGTFPRILGYYVREKHVLSLEEAVRRMSGFPAGRLSMWDRGLIRPGMKADLVIFDRNTVAGVADYEHPHQYSVGIRDVLVNGRLVLRNGKVMDERPGRVLYGPAKSAAADKQ